MDFSQERIALLLFFMACLLVPWMAVRGWVVFFLRRRRKADPGRRWPRWAWTGLLLVEIACIGYGYLIEPTWPEVTRHPVCLPGFSGQWRIVQLSDLHLDGREAFEQEVLDAVEGEQPDLVFLTGDYLNSPAHADDLARFLRRLVGLTGVQRLFAVGGNFEMDGTASEVFADAGLAFLNGVVVTVTHKGAAVQVAGIGWHGHHMAEQRLRDLASQLDPTIPAILLYHMPDLAESPGIDAFDLVVCGHTHGGQVRLPLYGALITMSRYGKRYEAGMVPLQGKTRMYVSRGVGLEPRPAPQVRFLCRPEIAVFELTGCDPHGNR
jgi:predicted MPP superfamily phosphohydrolase